MIRVRAKHATRKWEKTAEAILNTIATPELMQESYIDFLMNGSEIAERNIEAKVKKLLGVKDEQ